MRVRVGPLPSAGAGLWIAYARTVVGRVVVRPDELGVALPPDAIETMDAFLDEWEVAAADGPTFVWETDIAPDELMVLGGAWLDIATALARNAEARGYPISPSEGEAFYQALVSGFLDGLDAAGGEYAELAVRLRTDWPGLKTEEDLPGEV
jgi:hypothetical protein